MIPPPLEEPVSPGCSTSASESTLPSISARSAPTNTESERANSISPESEFESKPGSHDTDPVIIEYESSGRHKEDVNTTEGGPVSPGHEPFKPTEEALKLVEARPNLSRDLFESSSCSSSERAPSEKAIPILPDDASDSLIRYREKSLSKSSKASSSSSLLQRSPEGVSKPPLKVASQAPSREMLEQVVSEATLKKSQDIPRRGSHGSSMKATNKNTPRRASRGSAGSEMELLPREPYSKVAEPSSRAAVPSAAPLPIPQIEPHYSGVKRGLGMAAASNQTPIPLNVWNKPHGEGEEWPSFYDYGYQAPIPSLYDNQDPNSPINRAYSESILRSRSEQLYQIQRNARSSSRSSRSLFIDSNPQYSAEYEAQHPGFVHSKPTNFASMPGPSSLAYSPTSAEAYGSFPRDYSSAFGYGTDLHPISPSFVPPPVYYDRSLREPFEPLPEGASELPGDSYSSRSRSNSSNIYGDSSAGSAVSIYPEDCPPPPASFKPKKVQPPAPPKMPCTRQTDSDGIPWLVFEYPENRARKTYRIQCDIESIDAATFEDQFKRKNCVYPKALVPPEQYGGHRQGYEMNCNEIGWKLVFRNPTLAGHRGLTQRAVDTYRNTTDASTLSRRARRIAKQQRSTAKLPAPSTWRNR